MDIQVASSLLERTKKLNADADNLYILLGIALLEIEETKAYEGSYQSFADYYQQELNRDKSTVSRLTQVGKFFRDNNLQELSEGVNYSNVYEAMKALPDKPAEYVLEFAKQNTLADIREERSQAGNEHEHAPDTTKDPLYPCSTCGKLVHAS